MHRFVLCLFGVLLFGGVSVDDTFAQDAAIPLEIGVPHTFAIQEGAAFDDVALFSFIASTEPVIISLQPSNRDLAPTFSVFDSVGVAIGGAYDLDGRSFSLPRTYEGNVLIRAGRQEWVEAGGDMTILVQGTSAQLLAEDQTITGQLETTNHVAAYEVEANEGQLVSYGLTCEDCGITIIQPDGQIFDSAGVYDNPGAYLVRLHWVGKYTLIVETALPNNPYTLDFRFVEPILLQSDTPTTAMIGNQPTVFAFESAAGKAWEIVTDLPATGGRELQVMAFDPQRPLYESRLVGDQGSGPDGNARIEPFVAPEDGTYYVLAFYYDYSGSDVPVEGAVTLRPASLLSLVDGLALDGEITSDSGPVTYLYQGQQGEIITLDVLHTGGSSGMAVDVIGPSDEVMRMGGLNVLQVNTMLELPEDGTYRVIVDAVTYGVPELSYTITLAQQ